MVGGDVRAPACRPGPPAPAGHRGRGRHRQDAAGRGARGLVPPARTARRADEVLCGRGPIGLRADLCLVAKRRGRSFRGFARPGTAPRGRAAVARADSDPRQPGRGRSEPGALAADPLLRRSRARLSGGGPAGPRRGRPPVVGRRLAGMAALLPPHRRAAPLPGRGHAPGGRGPGEPSTRRARERDGASRAADPHRAGTP